MANSATASKTTGLRNSHGSVLLFSIYMDVTSYCGLLMAIPDNLCTIHVIMYDICKYCETGTLGFCWPALIPVISLVAAMTSDQRTGKPN